MKTFPLICKTTVLAVLLGACGPQAESPAASGGDVEVSGLLTDEGAECQALRADDKTLYTLTGELGGFKAGDRVRVTGMPAEMSFCQQGTTLQVKDIAAATE